MISNAKGRYIRISPMKIRLVTDLIKGKSINDALAILAQVNKGCSRTIVKILNSAVDNAKQKGLMAEQLFISKITANQGPVWKRFRAASFGRASGILKKTSHLNIELDLKTK